MVKVLAVVVLVVVSCKEALLYDRSCKTVGLVVEVVVDCRSARESTDIISVTYK